MTNLTESQVALLAAAAAAPEGAIDREGDARTIASLIKKGCLIALPQDDGPSWLLITTVGRAALEPAGDSAERPPKEVLEEEVSDTRAPAERPPKEVLEEEVSDTRAPAADEATPQHGEALTGRAKAQAEGGGQGDETAATTIEPVAAPSLPKGKVGALIQLLRQPTGTTVEAMMAATGWQAHSVRGALSGAIKKNLGLDVTSEKSDGGRVYRIKTEAQA